MTAPQPPRFAPIAIVGLGGIFPGSTDIGGFWQDILAGRDRITDVPPSHWLVEDYFDPDPRALDKTYCKRGAFLGDVPFDPIAFGIPPSSLPHTDTAQLLALMVAQQVLDDASNGQFAQMDRERISVILGVTSGQELLVQTASRLQRPVWLKALREGGVAEDEAQALCDRISAHYLAPQESTFPGLLGNVVAGRIANRFDLGGTNCITDAACASSLSAVSMAVNELQLGHSDVAIAGGVDAFNDISTYMCFSKTPALSPTGDCRPFSADADGTILGEGIGMVALKRLADAERDGDRIYAVLRGLGASSDGRASSIYAPVAEGQAKAIQRAYAMAGYGPETVELVEAHGTGTRAGDLAEFEGLRAVFEASGRTDGPWCALGSLKSQFGHTKAAAGIAGLLKLVLALHHRVLPPTIKVDVPNPKLGLDDSPFYLNTAARPWVRDAAHPRRASVSAFGFGGSNFHATLEEYGGPAARPERLDAGASELVLLSAEAAGDLVAAGRALVAAPPGALAAIARASQARFDATHPARLAVVADSLETLGDKLERAIAAIEAQPETAFGWPGGVHYAWGPAEGPVAFLFPGQGSQYVGMGAALAMAFEPARAVWDRAAGCAFAPSRSLHGVVFPPPAWSDDARAARSRALSATEWAQPALGTASLATLALLETLGVRPTCVGGHSFGELSALAAAGALAEPDLWRTARRRGELMAAAADVPGAMTAVSAPVAAVVPLLGPDVVIANHNGPRQVVLSGATSAIEQAERALAAQGLAFKRLPVSTAFHSPLVAGARAPFGDFLAEVPFGAPRVPVFANASAAPYAPEAGAIRAGLADQLASPVRFAEMVAAMHDAGARLFVEVGPGAVLSGLVTECLQGREFRAIALDRKGGDELAAFWSGLGQLAVAGVALDFARLWAGHRAPADPREAPRAPHAVPINGTNYGKLYPPPGGAAALPAPNPPRASERPSVQEQPPSHAQAAGPSQAAYMAYQQALTDAHLTYMQTMESALTQSHLAYMQAMERAYTAGAPMASGMPAMPLPTPLAPSAPRTATATEPPSIAGPVIERPNAENPVVESPNVESPIVENSAVEAAAIDWAALLQGVVADKTGYPIEALAMEMDLEADLGIDSIKRVEIMVAVQERVPALPEVPLVELAGLRTLGQIAAFLEDALAALGAAETTVAVAEALDAPVPLGCQLVREGPAAGGTRSLLDARSAGPLVIVPDGHGVAEALARRLDGLGVAVRVAPAVGPDAGGVVWLAGLKAFSGPEDAMAVHEEAFAAAQAVASRFAREGGLFVTVQDTGGDFGLSGRDAVRAWSGGLAGLAKTAALEWPRAAVKAIDMERGQRDADELADALLDELRATGPEPEVGLRADGRRTRPEVVSAEPGAAALSPQSLIVVTGGARGVTAAAIEQLACPGGPRLVLVGRTPLEDEPAAYDGLDEAGIKQAVWDAGQAAGTPKGPRKGPEGSEPLRVPLPVAPAEMARRADRVLADRERREAIARLEARGAEVRYVAADVRDAEALKRALAPVLAEWGPVTGLIHGAGVIADKAIAEQRPEDLARVFDTKVRGLQALLEATADEPLTLIALFSSVVARSGNAGQAAYAMANEVLNKVAAAEAFRRGPGCVVKSLNWGPWAGGMVTPALQAHFERRGLPLIPLEAGGALLLAALRTGQASQAEVLVGAPMPPEATRVVEARTEQALLAVTIGADTFPCVGDHRLQGIPVVPAVLALELFLRAASAWAPDGAPVTCRQLRVLKGIRLSEYETGGARFTVVGHAAQGALELELRAEAGTRHYAATIALEGAGPTLGDPAPLALTPAAGPAAALYGDQLFHGPAFQAIVELVGLAEGGAEAVLVGMPALAWPDGDWRSDVAALDGALQLASLWGAARLGRPSLPTGIGAYTAFVPGPWPGRVRCQLRGEVIGKHRTVSDLWLTSEDGKPLAELRGVEMLLVPEGAAALGEGAAHEA